MRERLRAPLAAAIAVLIGGDLAARGFAGILDLPRFLFPYLWLFLLFEALRRRRGLRDEEAFLLGAAVGLAADGALTKTLQDGVFFLGVNWAAVPVAAFDWGLATVLSLHAVDALLPRGEDAPAEGGLVARAALVFLPGAAAVSYCADAWSGRARVARMLGPAWLAADLLFVGLAWTLASRAWERAAEDEPRPRERGLWVLAAFAAWLPGAQALARLGGSWNALAALYAAAWTVGLVLWARALHKGSDHFDATPRRRVRAALAMAGWRFVVAALLAAAWGSASDEPRVAAAFSFFADLPVRLVFLTVFFSSRFAV